MSSNIILARSVTFTITNISLDLQFAMVVLPIKIEFYNRRPINKRIEHVKLAFRNMAHRSQDSIQRTKQKDKRVKWPRHGSYHGKIYAWSKDKELGFPFSIRQLIGSRTDYRTDNAMISIYPYAVAPQKFSLYAMTEVRA